MANTKVTISGRLLNNMFKKKTDQDKYRVQIVMDEKNTEKLK